MSKNVVEQERPQMTICRALHAGFVRLHARKHTHAPVHTHTHTHTRTHALAHTEKYVIFIAFPHKNGFANAFKY
jgi:hypothetical protein